MKFIKNIPKLTIGLAIVLAVLLVVLLVSLFGQKWYGVMSIKQEKNTATISAQDGQIVFQTQIDPSEQPVANQFLQPVGLSVEQVQNVSMGFDPDTVNFLSQFLPINVNLSLKDPKTLQFSGTINGTLPNINYTLASGSAVLNYQGGNPADIKITDPKTVINDATTSGQLNLSHKLDQAVTNLGKVDKINIHIENGKINGEIILN